MSGSADHERWIVGPSVRSPRFALLIAEALGEGPVIVEHRFYRGASAPARLVFDDIEGLDAYLKAHASSGDSIWVWSFGACCRAENALAHAKVPDSLGRVPDGGAY